MYSFKRENMFDLLMHGKTGNLMGVEEFAKNLELDDPAARELASRYGALEGDYVNVYKIRSILKEEDKIVNDKQTADSYRWG